MTQWWVKWGPESAGVRCEMFFYLPAPVTTPLDLNAINMRPAARRSALPTMPDTLKWKYSDFTFLHNKRHFWFKKRDISLFTRQFDKTNLEMRELKQIAAEDSPLHSAPDGRRTGQLPGDWWRGWGAAWWRPCRRAGPPPGSGGPGWWDGKRGDWDRTSRLWACVLVLHFYL